MTNIIILVLASITLISIVFSMILFTKVLELNKELDKAKLDLNKTKEDAQELMDERKKRSIKLNQLGI